MRTSRKGGLFIAHEEAAVLVPYPDGAHLSIGFGHNGPDVGRNMKITLERAMEMLQTDLVRYEALVEKNVKVPLEQNQFDALVSLAYNRANAGIKPVAAKLNAGDVDGAMSELLHDPNPGRHGRRMRERMLFVAGTYGDLSMVKVYDKNPRVRGVRPRAVSTAQWLDDHVDNAPA